jgi:mono/diheme cytochrome c family protein
MRNYGCQVALALWLSGGAVFSAALTPQQIAQLPLAASHTVDFAKEIKPILSTSCAQCHGRGKDKGGFKLDTRETFLKGGDSGPAAMPSKSAESLLIQLVAAVDPDNVMPKKGTRLTAEQVGLLRAWIDQGVNWDASVTFARSEPANLKPRVPPVPRSHRFSNPIDCFLQPYFAADQFHPPPAVNDRLFVRRVYLDVLGLLPPPEVLNKFVRDVRPDKRERLVEQALANDSDYAQHWMSFWNDMLRNDYKGTGYIDSGRKQITFWLYSALQTNMPYDKFVAGLINPGPDSEGFVKGIVWRGVVNASQTPEMQAAQGISQVFMGVNLKCASCHDSFINDLTLADSYGLASIYATNALEMVRCDRPTGKKADIKFLYPELGAVEWSADKPARLKQLAQLLTAHRDGRLTRTFVNRVWQRFMGRGLVEPVDDMEQPAWNPDLLDWLAEDFAAHNYDVKFLIRRILTSNAYQLPSINTGEQPTKDFVFHGPLIRRMTAEEFRDALATLTGVGYTARAAEIPPSPAEQKRWGFTAKPRWIWNDPKAVDKVLPGHVHFRKAITLEQVPDEATAIVACDNSFSLSVNGQDAGSGNDFKNATLIDIKKFLKAGTNLFAIDAVNNLAGNVAPNATNVVAGTENPAALLFFARLRSGSGQHQRTNDFVSDSSWIWSTNKAEKWKTPEFIAEGWQNAIDLGDMEMEPWKAQRLEFVAKLAAVFAHESRTALVVADPLAVALGRPNREQVVTVRAAEATTLQALEMTNGETLDSVLKRGAARLLKNPETKKRLVQTLYAKALGRKPTRAETRLAKELIGQPPQATGVEDALWAFVMLPEFQLIY